MDAFDTAGYGLATSYSPDLSAKNIGKDRVAATLTMPEVPFGTWFVSPLLIGPFGSAGALTGRVRGESQPSRRFYRCQRCGVIVCAAGRVASAPRGHRRTARIEAGRRRGLYERQRSDILRRQDRTGRLSR